jgi:predicted PurR-regulated permease PerM
MPTLAHIPGYALGLLGGLADLLLVAAGGIYLSIQPEAYYAGFLRLFSPTHRKSVRAVGGEIASNLRRWLFGQIAAMAIVGFMVGIAMWAIGVPAAGALGIFAGLAEFVPIAGPISATIPALLMALLIGIDKAGWTLLIFVIIQQVEGNIIIPIIQQRMVRIPPVVTIFAIVVFGLLFGLIGIVLATPLTIMASVQLNHYLHDRDLEA